MDTTNYEIQGKKVIIDKNIFAFYKDAYDTAQAEADNWLVENKEYVDAALRESEREMRGKKYLDGRSVFADLRKKHGC